LIIIKSINIKNSIIYVINIILFIIIQSINIKNSIICVTNIIIFIIIISFNIKIIFFIIINIINKIINKFWKKNYYQYWKTTIDLIWKVRLKNIVIVIVIIKHCGLLYCFPTCFFFFFFVMIFSKIIFVDFIILILSWLRI
jgi:hypothetical protein